MARIAPHGSWVSPISAELAASAAISFSGLQLDGSDVYWLENRPTEGGRCTIVRRTASGQIAELTPPAFSVRSTAHEYGGGAFAVKGGTLFFTNFHDQRIYRQEPGRAPLGITHEAGYRFADLVVDHGRARLICVREDHGRAGEPRNAIAAVRMDGSACHMLVSGNDFYSNPRLSPDGTRLAYLTWNHPNMPWDGCELFVAQVDADGAVGPGRHVAGGPSEAIFQPEWSPGGVLHYVSDSTGWWNLNQWKAGEARPVCPMPAEFGRAMWSFGYSTYGFASETRLFCSYAQQGVDHLAWLDTQAHKLTPIHSPYTKVDLLQCSSEGAAFVGASPTSAATIVCFNVNSGVFTPVQPSSEFAVDIGFLSMPQALEWASPSGVKVPGFYYAPANPDFGAPGSSRPPLLVLCHGGPTSAAASSLRYPVQFWTSRGFAVLDVNYSGSTGYGREYRNHLRGQWGVNDVEDCCSGALFLAGTGTVDRTRMSISGRQRRWFHRPFLPGPPQRCLRCRFRLLRRGRPGALGQGFSQIRISLSGWSDRSVPCAPGSVRRAAHRSETWMNCAALSCSCRARMIRLFRPLNPGSCSRPYAERGCRPRFCDSKVKVTAFAGPKASSAHKRRSSTSYPGSSASICLSRSSPSELRICLTGNNPTDQRWQRQQWHQGSLRMSGTFRWMARANRRLTAAKSPIALLSPICSEIAPMARFPNGAKPKNVSV